MDIDAIIYWQKVVDLALKFPEAVLSTSYGTPAVKVRKKLFARLKEDGRTLVVYTNEREKWMNQDPAVFFITDHYKNYPAMLIDLRTVRKKDLGQLLLSSWKLRAPKKIAGQS